jgi:N-terminal 7TM region of histidine kinase
VNLSIAPISAPLLIATAILIILASYCWYNRSLPGAPALGLLAVSTAVWTLTYALERTAPDVPTKLFWAKAQYAGIVTAPIAWLVFTAQYAARSVWFTPPRIALILIVPALTLLLVMTNESHRLIWQQVASEQVAAQLVLDLRYGPWFWVHATYSYLALLVGSILLLRMTFYTQALYRSQVSLLLLSALAPWVGNALSAFRLGIPGLFDLTPFAFGVSALILGWTLFRYQLLALVPLAHDTLIRAMRCSCWTATTGWLASTRTPSALWACAQPRSAAGRSPSIFRASRASQRL